MSAERITRPLPTCFLGKEAATTHIALFKEGKHQLLTEDLGRQDTKSIWYNFIDIENIYKELIFLNADGIRIYFGQYEDTHPDYSNQLCLVFVPTRFNGDTSGHEDIVLEDEKDFEARPGSQMFLDASRRKAYNYGSPCPPVCPPKEDSKYPMDL